MAKNVPHDASAGEWDSQIVRDRNDFLAALDSEAPHVLKSLEYCPVERADNEREAIRLYAWHEATVPLYVAEWVKQWPALRAMPWFLHVAEVQVRVQDR